jgi:2-polyprenyl-6-methoxyphenol hydroxylase-like FAD-dependent oxidoreductase
VRAIVVGAGIGGLTTAIALRRAGIVTAVFERAGELAEVGAGILLAANAVRALGELGLSDEVSQLGTPASAGRICSWRGETLVEMPARKLEMRFGAPSVAVNPLLCRLRDAALKATPTRSQLRQLDNVLRYEGRPG